MKRTALLILIILTTAAISGADTFRPLPYIADAGVDALTKSVANAQLGRDLFGHPYATVVIGQIDVYDGFPYLEARYFQIVSDPSWDRILLGEVGRTPVAYDGSSNPFGALDGPRGMSSDERGHLYVADAGNDRVLVVSLAGDVLLQIRDNRLAGVRGVFVDEANQQIYYVTASTLLVSAMPVPVRR